MLSCFFGQAGTGSFAPAVSEATSAAQGAQETLEDLLSVGQSRLCLLMARRQCIVC